MKGWISSLCLSSLICLVSCTFLPRKVSITSPDGSLETELFVRAGKLYYTIYKDKELIFRPSLLGLHVNNTELGRSARIGQPQYNSEAGNFFHLENRDTISYRFNEVIIPVLHRRSGLRFKVEWRVYNDGIAFRYLLGESFSNQRVLIKEEFTEWNLAKIPSIWYPEETEESFPIYVKGNLEQQMEDSMVSLPILLQHGDSSGYSCLFESEELQHSSISLAVSRGSTFNTKLNTGSISWERPHKKISTWRGIQLTDNLHALLDNQMAKHIRFADDVSREKHNRLTLPGKMLSYRPPRDTSIHTHFSSFLDQSTLLKINYILLDVPNELSADTTFLNELLEISRSYESSLWIRIAVATIADVRFRRNLFAYYQKNGIVGVEISQFPDLTEIERANVLEEYIEEANAFQLMVSISEGANGSVPMYALPGIIGYKKSLEINHQGNELENIGKLQAHYTILPFVQSVRGLGSYSLAQTNITEHSPFKLVYPLANTVLLHSALSHWTATPQEYLFHPAIDILQEIPSHWEETQVLDISDLGSLTAIARRSGEQWFLGLVNGPEAQEVEIPLHFLSDQTYEASLVKDPSKYTGGVLRSGSIVNNQQSLPIALTGGGGVLVKFHPSTLPLQSIEFTYADTYVESPTQVSMQVPEANYSIRYTLDGTEVSEKSSLYRKPIVIRKSLNLKAKAFDKREAQFAKEEEHFFSFKGPGMLSGDTLFWKETYVELEPSENKTIRYTTNGREPGWRSPIYRKPIKINRTTTISAAYFIPIGIQSEVSVRTYRMSIPKEADSVGTIRQGLRYAYKPGYTISPTTLFSENTVKKGIVRSLRPKLSWMSDSNYTMTFRGLIRIDEDNLYTINVLSDGEVYVNLADKNIVHHVPNSLLTESAGSISLKKGWHRIIMAYVGRLGENKVQLSLATPFGDPIPIKSNDYYFD